MVGDGDELSSKLHRTMRPYIPSGPQLQVVRVKGDHNDVVSMIPISGNRPAISGQLGSDFVADSH